MSNKIEAGKTYKYGIKEIKTIDVVFNNDINNRLLTNELCGGDPVYGQVKYLYDENWNIICKEHDIIINIKSNLQNAMKKYFITFGGPASNYHDAVNKICNQAKKIELFDEIIGYTEKDLQNDQDFWAKHSNFIQNNHRGYGYWIWKSYLILKTLNKMEDNDLLLYLDCGCEINYYARDEMIELFNKMNDKVLVCSSAEGCNIEIYTKMDTINFIENTLDTKVNMMQAGILLLKKSDIIIKLISEWYNLCSNYHLINDAQSLSSNVNGFKEHRHDQSILNLLVLKYNLINYDIGTPWCSGNWHNCAKKWPIWTLRNKSGYDAIQNLKN